MKPETKEVIELVRDIRDIENEICQLEDQKKRLEYRLDQLVISRTTVINIQASQAQTPRRGRVASETSAKNLIANLLNSRPDTDFDAEMVSAELELNINTVRTNLSRLKGENLIEKRAFNKYGAVTGKAKEATSEEMAS